MNAMRIASLVLLAGSVSSACSLAPGTRLPEPVVSSPAAIADELPAEFSDNEETGAYESLEWWQAFADPVLDTIVESVLTANPDIAVAVARVQQAREAARIARAAFLPTIRARASVDDFSSPTNAGIGAQLQELGLGEEARFNEVAAAYGRTVVTAVNEVETALAGMRYEGRRRALLESRREEAQAEVDLQAERYGSGVGGYADFLDALRTLLDAESALAGSERDVALARLAVHRALGAGWVPSDLLAGPRIVPASTRTEGRSG